MGLLFFADEVVWLGMKGVMAMLQEKPQVDQNLDCDRIYSAAILSLPPHPHLETLNVN